MLTPSARVGRITLAEFDTINTRAATLRAAGHHVISLGQAVPDFGPPPAAVEAAAAAAHAGECDVYSTDAGRPSLREALAARLRAGGCDDVDAADLVISAGANQAFFLAATTILDQDDEVLLPAPYFANHEMTIRAVGARPIEVPLAADTGFVATWAAIEPHVTSRTRAVVLCNPSNPTGAVAGGKELTRIVEELARRRVWLITDETYLPFVYSDEPALSAATVPGWRHNVIVVSTFSKMFGMTGWRAGFLLADRSICAEAIKVQDAMIICAPVVSQIAAETAIRDHWDYPRSFHAELRDRRRVLAAGLAAIPRARWVTTAGGFFAFVRVDGCADSAALSAQLIEQAHVVTIPGSTFGRCGEGYLRLSYGSVRGTELREAITRIGRALAN